MKVQIVIKQGKETEVYEVTSYLGSVFKSYREACKFVEEKSSQILIEEDKSICLEIEPKMVILPHELINKSIIEFNIIK
jgi:hypothetical protein